MSYQAVERADREYFQSLLGEEAVLFEREHLERYSADETEDLHYLPELVLLPKSSEEVAAVLRYCNQRLIAVTPSGARTGLSGGALSLYGGVVLSAERLNRIIQIDEANSQVTVEPGVINQVLHNACKEKGLFYPPDPSSWGSSFIGGNLALNAGGPKAVKYGVTNAYVLNLEVALANGEVFWTGANVLKNSTGYNLTQLIVGSEGTLGFITKAVLKLIPYPKQNVLMLVPFASAEKACEAVAAIFQAGITPSGLEFMERDAIDWTLRFVSDVQLPVGDEVQAHLLIELDGNHENVLLEESAAVAEIVEGFEAGDILFADTDKDKEALWRLRRRVGEAVKSHSIYKEEDTVVPRAQLPALLRGVKSIGNTYGFQSVCYGHAGDGNLHVNIIKGELTDRQWREEVPKGIRELFELVKSLGGTISGEHGIGLVQKPYLDVVFGPTEMALHRGIKSVFDPNNILNPGKVFD